MEKTKIILGSDPGYGWNKHVFSGLGNNVWDSRIFPSLYTENPPRNTSIEILEESDPFTPNFHKYFIFSVRKLDDPHGHIRTFAVGDKVRDYTRKIIHESFAIQRDQAQIIDWIFSIIAMLAATRNATDYSIGLTVPVNEIESMEQYLKKYNIKGEYEVNISNEPNFNITKKVKIISFYLLEQAIAALYNEVYEISQEGVPVYKNRSLKNKRILIIDIGTNTINYALTDEMNIVSKDRLVESGAAKLIKRIKEEIAQKYRTDMSYSKIQKKLLQNKFIINYTNQETGIIEDANIIEKIDNIKKDIFENIIFPAIKSITTSSTGQESDIDKILFTGGGVKLFAQFLKPQFSSSKVIIPEHPQLANALGMWKSVYIAEYDKLT